MNPDCVLESNEEEVDLGDGGFGVELSFFVDREAVVAFIKEICSANWEVSFQRFEWLVATLSKYQEQPTLLNPHLSEMLTPMTEIMISIATTVANDTTRVSLLEVLYDSSCFSNETNLFVEITISSHINSLERHIILCCKVLEENFTSSTTEK